MAERRTSVRLSVVGGRETKAELAAIGEAGQRSLARIGQATQPASAGLRALDAAAGEVRQGIDQFAARAGPLGGVLGALGPAGLAAAAGIGGMAAALAIGLRDLAEAERLSLRLEQVLRATGHAAGLTAGEIEGLADQMELATFATAEEVKEAAAVLATFRSVQGDVFREALILAQDLSAVFGQSLTGSVTQLGKALEDPIQGINALRRSGISFNATQREMIEQLVKTGDTAAAQRIILDTLAIQVGGAGAAETAGLAGAFDRTTDAIGNFLERLAQVTGAADATRAALNTIAGGLEGINAALGETQIGQEVVEANNRLLQMVAAREELAKTEAELRAKGEPLMLIQAEALRQEVAEADADIGALRTEIDGLIARGREEVAEIRRAEEGAAVAAAEAKTEKALGRLRDIRRELEGFATPEEKIERVRQRLAETVEELGNLRTAPGPGMIDQAIAAAEELARRQIEAIEKPAREAAEREAAQTQETIAGLTRTISQFGDTRAQFVERYLAQLGETATDEERAAVERLAGALHELERAQRARASGTGIATEASRKAKEAADAEAEAERERQRLMEEGERIRQSLQTATQDYADTVGHLRELLDAEAISLETFNRAAAQAWGELMEREAEERTRRLREEGGLFGAAQARLEEYVEAAGRTAEVIEEAFAQAFSGAEDAIADFVRTGRFEFASLVTSMLADLARLSVRQAVLGPLAGWLGNLLGSAGTIGAGGSAGAGLVSGWKLHGGGVAGEDGQPVRVAAAAFLGAPRLHDGGLALRPDEIPAILQRGERVLSREEARRRETGGPVVQVNITATDAESFRRSRTQVAADIARAVAFGSRGL
ncbi:MAG TPA: phage tail tape measure C-terminal domain-containing protein [Paracoccaceae bacterium]|nr:phage tail tape measure C-terminal domain-containing protein [Paracoccaceae bacterium]